MRKDSCKGWKNIFSFTLIQTLKSKAYRGGLIFMVVLLLVSVPLMNLLMGNAAMDGSEGTDIEKVYVVNATMYRNLDILPELPESYRKILFETTTETPERIQQRLVGDETEAVLLVLAEDENASYIQLVKSPEGSVADYELQILGQGIANAYSKARIRTLGISEQQIAYLSTSVAASTGIVDTEKALLVEDSKISQSEYWFLYIVMFVILMTSVMSSSQVASSIVSDKASKVLEYLMTSVRPLAIIVGKVLSMLLAALIQLAVMFLAGFVSTQLGKIVSGGAPNAISQYISPEILAHLNPGTILIGVAVAVLGMVLYAILAGLCGATVSRMEEVSESLTVLTISSLVGFYIGIIAAGTLMGGGDNVFATFALLFPLSSAFLLPGALLVGKANVWIAALSGLILLVSIVLLFRFVARVYETLILHNGKRIKMKELFAISKNNKKGAKEQHE